MASDKALAGSFFHLWLAQQAFVAIHRPAAESADSDLHWQAFAAGVLAPDIGFFPGGPQPFSDRVHREGSGDFVRQLYSSAQGEVEKAFAAGWALHIYTDALIHPWVNEQVAAFLQGRRTRAVHEDDLWHLRLEWGIDCFLLGRSDAHFLWRMKLLFPQRSVGPGLLAQVGRARYGEVADEVEIGRGSAALVKWIGLLPRIFLWTGQIQPNGSEPLAAKLGSLLRPCTEGTVGKWLDGRAAWKNVASVSRPWHPREDRRVRALGLGRKAVEDFCGGYSEAFAALPNFDLNSGEVIS